MEKLVIPVSILVAVFLYFTYDAGFQFERASELKRIQFVERQAHKAAWAGNFTVSPGPSAILVAHDQQSVRLSIPAEKTSNLQKQRSSLQKQACKGYTSSHLDEHGIELRLVFFRESGAMAGTMTLSRGVCASQDTRIS